MIFIGLFAVTCLIVGPLIAVVGSLSGIKEELRILNCNLRKDL